MGIILRIAWRNLWRRPLRTVLTASTVSLGLSLLLISLGLGDGSHRQMIESGVRMGSGHVVVAHWDYHQQGGVERFLSEEQWRNAELWIKRNAERFGVQQTVKRVFASGLASSADGSTGVQIFGIDPDAEASVSTFADKVEEGGFLEGSNPQSVVVGEGVARKLAVGLGGRVVVMVQGASSQEIQSLLLRVTGIIRSGLKDLDQSLLLMPLSTAQKFLGLGGGVHQLAVLLSQVRDADRLADLGKAYLPAQVEVLSWDEALPELRDFIRIDDGGNYVFQFFIFLLIAFMVMNTIFMSVLERGREFALLDALGLTPARRFFMVLLEGASIGVLSVGAGSLIGYAVHLRLEKTGLPLDLFYSGELSAAGVVMDPIMYSSLSWQRITGSLVLVFALTLILTIIPAWRAARSPDMHLLSQS